jgi:hypothetical protein
MSTKDWQDAVKKLKETTSPTTLEQLELAKLTGVSIEKGTPRIIAAAKLRVALAKELYLPPAHPVSERTKSLLNILQSATGILSDPLNEDEGAAWVIHLRLVQRYRSLEQVMPCPGDVVSTNTDELAIISSIGEDGRIYFKGGRGFGAWPDQISMIAPVDDENDTAEQNRRKAENLAATRSLSSGWSNARRQELSKYLVEIPLSEEDVNEFQLVINKADDERPIQRYLEQYPHLLSVLVSGQERYCIPQKRLGGEYIPDFLVGSVDSLGIHWIFVELETPKTNIYLKDGHHLGANARKGVSQVTDWRGWVTENLSYARKKPSENGLGLFDIRPESEAVVLVGRRSGMVGNNEAERNQLRERQGIHVHSYDWLIDALIYSLHYTGLPIGNHYLIRGTGLQ